MTLDESVKFSKGHRVIEVLLENSTRLNGR